MEDFVRDIIKETNAEANFNAALARINQQPREELMVAFGSFVKKTQMPAGQPIGSICDFLTKVPAPRQKAAVGDFIRANSQFAKFEQVLHSALKAVMSPPQKSPMDRFMRGPQGGKTAAPAINRRLPPLRR